MKLFETLSFEKFEGTKNDFIFLEIDPQQFGSTLTEKIHFLCDRNSGVGADGVVFLFSKRNETMELAIF